MSSFFYPASLIFAAWRINILLSDKQI